MKTIVNDDFDLYKIAYSGQCFRVKELDKDTFEFITANSKVTITDLDYSNKSATDDITNLEISCSLEEWSNIWHDYFDLDTCYRDIRAAIPAEDNYLKKCAQIGEGIRILKQDKFEMLISFIISQRKSIPAIKTSVERICNLYGQEGYFPTASAMLNATDEELSGCGLGYRVSYIMDAVRRVALKETDLNELDKLDDEKLFESLKSFKGVGDKVANCVELFAYHRTARAPIDTWIKKVIDSQYNGVNPFDSYGSVAGIMQQYIFYAAQHMHEL